MRLKKCGTEGLEALVRKICFGQLYPRAVITGRQSGEVFSNGRAALIWHRCGFAWLAGEYGTDVLEEVLRLKAESERRLVLFTADEQAVRFFEARGAQTGRRYFFEYHAGRKEPRLPEGFEARDIDAKLFGRLSGRVLPAVFWNDAEQFLKNGKGICIMRQGEPAAWAFSASADGLELDIGVETASEFRGRGLASAAAEMMINYAIETGCKPVWACDSGNAASKGLAEKLGFQVCAECVTVR